MKTLFLFFCLSILFAHPDNVFAQRNNVKKTEFLLKFQHGIFFNMVPSTSYGNFNFGVVTRKESIYQEFSFLYNAYTKELDIFSPFDPGINFGSLRQGFSLETEYFRSAFKKELGEIELILGYFGSLSFFKNETTPFTTTISFPSGEVNYPSTIRCYCFSVGPKVNTIIHLGKSIAINISSKLYLFDVGFGETQIHNTALPIFAQKEGSFHTKFFRQEFLINVGLNIRIK